jgi:hypothetical protein
MRFTCRSAVEDPVQAVGRIWLIAAAQAGVNAGLQVLSERPVNGRDAAGCRADRLLHRHPGAFLAGTGRAGPPAETGAAGELMQECVAFCAQRVKPADV